MRTGPTRLAMTAENMLASLRGDKTQTRRVIRNACDLVQDWDKNDPTYGPYFEDRYGDSHKTVTRCPYGNPGDPLVLTETWRPLTVKQDMALIRYRAGDAEEWRRMPNDDAREKIERALKHGKWLPPMFMQAWASRAPAVNTEVRVERVQDISEEDAKAEGVEYGYGWEEESGEGYCDGDGYLDYVRGGFLCDTARDSFCTLWNSINKKRGHGWDANDWVWAVTYKLAKGT